MEVENLMQVNLSQMYLLEFWQRLLTHCLVKEIATIILRFSSFAVHIFVTFVSRTVTQKGSFSSVVLRIVLIIVSEMRKAGTSKCFNEVTFWFHLIDLRSVIHFKTWLGILVVR